MTITTLNQAEAVLAQYIAEMKAITGKDLTVGRMKPLMECLGNPHQKLRVIHVAGTSGKTSTSYFIADLLRRGGQRVGLTVSPHIDRITERVQLNGEPIPEQMFCQYLSQVLERVSNLNFRPSYFELLIGLALYVFVQEKVNYAVVETGLGGLHDATNIITRHDKIAVITDIGFDHMHILGTTLASISAQKAGIIHPGNQVFMHRQNSVISDVICKQVAQVDEGAKLTIVTEASPAHMPLFQARNWTLAKAVYDYLKDRDGLSAVAVSAIADSQSLIVPGRINQLTYQGRLLIIDGAHNAQKMDALVCSVQAMYPTQRWTVIAAFKKGKDYKTALTILSPIAKQWVFTQFAVHQDSYVESTEPSQLVAFMKSLGTTDSLLAKTLAEAVKTALKIDKSAPIIITGSLYLAGQARSLLIT